MHICRQAITPYKFCFSREPRLMGSLMYFPIS